MIRISALLFSLLLALSPAAASYSGGMDHYQRYDPQPMEVLGPFCGSDASDLTTYTHTIALTGVADTDPVVLWVGYIGEDSATNFGVNSSTVDGVALQEVGDEAGSGVINTAIYRTNTNAYWYLNAASVDVAVTYSEAVTSSTVCVWALKNNFVFSSASGASVGDSTDSSAIALAIAFDQIAYAATVSVCGSASAADTTTWTGVTEGVDTNNGEHSYSAAHLLFTANFASSAFTSTCDYAGSDDASQTTVAVQR